MEEKLKTRLDFLFREVKKALKDTDKAKMLNSYGVFDEALRLSLLSLSGGEEEFSEKEAKRIATQLALQWQESSLSEFLQGAFDWKESSVDKMLWREIQEESKRFDGEDDEG